METLNSELVQMGTVVEKALSDTIVALIEQDKDLCEQVTIAEKTIDKMRTDIESRALRVLLMQQPVARDLRMISTALKIISDLERIGDQARDICGIVVELCDENYQINLEILPQMAELSKTMVRSCVDSFVKQDVDMAAKIIEMDTGMDELFDKLKAKLLKMLKKKTDYADQLLYFLMIGKYFEKIGDHAENIAQWIIFSRSGIHKSVKIL